VVDVELVPAEQDEWREICRPPNALLLQVIEDMSDGHVVESKNEFALFGFPNGNSPVADDAREAVGFPMVEGGSDDFDIGRIGFEIIAKLGNEVVAIVEATVPGEDKTSAREVG